MVALSSVRRNAPPMRRCWMSPAEIRKISGCTFSATRKPMRGSWSVWKRNFGKRRRSRFWKASQHFFLRRVNAGGVQHPSLCCLLHLDCKPNVLSLLLSVGSVRLLRDHDIHYTRQAAITVDAKSPCGRRWSRTACQMLIGTTVFILTAYFAGWMKSSSGVLMSWYGP